MSDSTRKSLFGQALFFLKLLEIRLRFVALLALTALVVGYWDTIQNYYERWQRNRLARGGHAEMAGAAAGESEYEYACGMHPFVVRDRAGKCPICGMDLTRRKKGAAVELPAGTLARVQASPDRIMQAGVVVEPVAYRLLSRTVRAYGVIEPAETRLARIIARFPGRIDELMVNAVGQVVRKDEPLARIYSPKYLAAAQEYLQAVKTVRPAATPEDKRRADQLAAYARQRLALAGFTDKQLDEIAATGKVEDTVTLFSPLAGTVLERDVLLGQMVEEGSALYTIADLSTLWVQALVLESDLSAVKVGMPVEVSSVSWPGRIFYGTVDFIYPAVNMANRSVKVRVVVDNAAGDLKPGMYITVVLRAPYGRYGEAAGKAGALAESAGPSPSPAPTTSAASLKLPTDNAADADRFYAMLKPGETYYVCAMDEDVYSDKPGDCPVCGMRLDEAEKEGEAGAAEAVAPAPPAASGPPPRLPTDNQSDAARFLTTLAPGAAYYTCVMDAEVVSDKPGDCPVCGMHLSETRKPTQAPPPDPHAPSMEQWAEGYSCAMHPDELSPQPGVCAVCDCGMPLKKTRIERVVSIPESAVIDTGARQVVYVETMPGVYDSRAVTLGPRLGAFYPVIAGLKLGDRVATRGSFLIDAEARLNPTVAYVAPVSAAPTPAAGGGAHQH